MGENGKIRALLVDDSEDDAILFRLHLKRLGSYEIDLTHISQVSEAEAAIAGDGFEMIFATWASARGPSGIDLLKRAREKGIKTPFVIVTGAGDAAKAVEAMKGGAYDYLDKDDLSPALIEGTIRWVRRRLALERERDEAVARLEELERHRRPHGRRQPQALCRKGRRRGREVRAHRSPLCAAHVRPRQLQER